MAETAALPVLVDVDARLRGALVAHLEGTLGWQVTDGRDLPPVLRLCGVGAVAAPAPVPTVLLVRADDPPHAAATAGRAAAAVLRWPEDRDRLPAVAGRLEPGAPTRTPTVSFAGAAGGVGVTTVVLAVGGLLAWSGRPVLAVVSGDVPVPDVVRIAPAALGGHRTIQVAVEAPGVPGLQVVGTLAGPRAEVSAPPGTVVLRDDGPGSEGDVLVVRRDRAGHEAIVRSAAALVVVVDHGPVPLSRLRSALAGRATVILPWSERVARAGVLQRVPAALPGRWLRDLVPLARSFA